MRHEFVEYIPKDLQPDTVYVSMENETVVHSCFCGCGGRVVTPLSPTDWKLTFDGETISLYPSIGNWNLACKSHYWIRNGQIVWAERWSDARVDAGHKEELQEKRKYYDGRNASLNVDKEAKSADTVETKKSWWAKVRSWISISRM